MSSSTELFLPSNLPYPINILSLDSPTSSTIHRGSRLLSYSFIHLPPNSGDEPETRFGTWDASVDGEIVSWNIKPGQVIIAKKALEKPVLVVLEPCKHGIQIGGLCGVCGKDMTDFDYTGWSDASRASIQMTHDAFGPTVSFEEAQKLEKASAEHLLKSRKLSLIVDLDQTIVHATVDPTVGEWYNEGQAWEQQRMKKAAESGMNDSDLDISEVEDDCNPNWPALRDVKSFRLGPESFLAGSQRGSRPGKSTNYIENEGCLYYIKPRPGWQEFLERAAERYEMHVYTMGTRAYAEQVCKIIDPDGKYFATRILSRDESGSLTQKNLRRLFPCDTSMVVIIDDRADVWEWSPNLIKVVPYDFFVGIGDINSAFLPKVEPLAPTATVKNPSPTPVTPVEADEEADKAKSETKALMVENSIALEAQRDERPLAKKQEQLQDTKVAENQPEEASSSSTNQPQAEAHQAAEQPVDKQAKKPLLKNNDWELIRVGSLLNHVHDEFFEAYKAYQSDSGASELPSRKKAAKSRVLYDVTQIIPRMRSDTFKGLNLLFSSVIPLDTRPETTEIWKMAHLFGATCSTELTSSVTHVVAAKKGTMKVDAARRRGGIKIVWLAWFTDSIALWRHQDETPYLLEEPKPLVVQGINSSPTSDPTQISSDPEPDDEEWQHPQPSLELDSINWDDINDEVEAAMNESDDESVRSEKSYRSGNVSEAEEGMSDDPNSTRSTPTSTPRLKRKRPRSSTPSEREKNGDSELLRSPLSKRKKLAAERAGSLLKQGVTALDVESATSNIRPPSKQADTDAAPTDGSGSDSEVELDDDFLAREFEEEWG
jgi:RNA polymerase II subunit A-like phosphatase